MKMKVRDLIAELQKIPPEIDLQVEINDEGDGATTNDIKIRFTSGICTIEGRVTKANGDSFYGRLEAK